MPSQLVYECPVLLPTLDRAEQLVPWQFVPCYDWFIANAGNAVPKLPHHMENRPQTPIPLSRDSGIYVPGAAQVSYDGDRRYALSVHSNSTGRYDDRAPIPLADGTWILDYAAHQGSDVNQQYNRALMNCLEDGIPVGVMTRERRGGYLVRGLAFVECYNSVTRMFTLHGPVSHETEARGAFVPQGFDDLSPEQQQIVVEYDGEDERRRVTAQQVRREQQSLFRSKLLEAYNEACAISGTNVTTVLQAAHINPYRGRRSQIVQNGLLLRADLHLLYDAHLISVTPDHHDVVLSKRLSSTEYARYESIKLREPFDPAQSPSDELLAIHYEQFRRENELFVA